MTSLVELDLSGNCIESVQPHAFKSLKSLKNLALNRNRLRIFDENSFNGLSQLEQLDLSENKIASLRELNHLNMLKNLKLLILNGNPSLELGFNLKDLTCLKESFKIMTNLAAIFMDSSHLDLNDFFYKKNTNLRFYYNLREFDTLKNNDFKLNSA